MNYKHYSSSDSADTVRSIYIQLCPLKSGEIYKTYKQMAHADSQGKRICFDILYYLSFEQMTAGKSKVNTIKYQLLGCDIPWGLV